MADPTFARLPTSVDYAGQLVWRIGEVGQGPAQFGEWSAGCEFTIGRSTTKQFPGFQASAEDGVPSATAVVFALDEVVAPAYELVAHIHIVGPAPQLELDMNGASGVFLLDPTRDGHTLLTHPSSPASGWTTLRASIPARHLRAGDNRLVLTTRLDADPAMSTEVPPGYRPHGPAWEAGLYYAWLELRAAESVPPASARVVPLPLFRDDLSGLVELTDLIVTLPDGSSSVTARLTVGDHEADMDLATDGRAFGEVRARVGVPDQAGPTPATVVLDVDGDTSVFETEFRPCRKWTLHLLPHVHLDIGYTDYQGKVFELHNRNLERALDIVAARPDFRYWIDGSFIVERYLATREPAASAAVLNAIRAGQLALNGFFALFLTGVASLEECYRAGYAADDVAREYGVPVTFANLTDVPSYSWAIPSVLGQLGIERFVGISNHIRASNDDSDVLHLLSPVRWRGVDGSEVLAFFSDGYAQLLRLFGKPLTMASAADVLHRFTRRYDRDDYLPADLPIVGMHVDNEDLDAGEASFVDAWNATFRWPRIRYSTINEYFDAVAPLYEELPVVEGDGGSYWEDGVGAGAAVTAAYRCAQTAVPVAEAATVLASLLDDRLGFDRVSFDRAWTALLFGCEHTWTASHVTKRPHSESTHDQLAWKTHQVDIATRAAADLGREAVSRLAEMMPTEECALVVCNTLPWARTAELELEVKEGDGFRDTDGLQLEATEIGRRDGLPVIRVRTTPIPPFGYRVFRPARDGGPRGGWEELPPVIETGRWRAEVDLATGRIVQLVDRVTGRELIDRGAAFALGEVVYVQGGGTEDGRGLDDERTTLYMADYNLRDPELTLTPVRLAPSGMRPMPWGTALRFEGEGPSLRDLAVEVTLHDAAGRVDVDVTFDKEAILAKESVYVAFPFAFERPQVRYDRQQGWVDPTRDQYPGACVEWFTTQQAVGLFDDAGAVVWVSREAPLFTLGDVVRGRWPSSCDISSGTLLSWPMNNYWFTNYPASQSGPSRFRYSFMSLPAWDPAAAARFGRDIRTPVLWSQVTELDKADDGERPLPEHGRSLLDVDADDNVVVSVVAQRHGRGPLLRIQEVAGRPGRATIVHPWGAAGRALRCTATEHDVEPLAVDSEGRFVVEVGADAVISVKVSPA